MVTFAPPLPNAPFCHTSPLKDGVVVRIAGCVDDAAAGAGAADHQRRSAGVSEDSGDLPVADRRAQHLRSAVHLVTGAEGQLVDEDEAADVAGGRWCPDPFPEKSLLGSRDAHQIVQFLAEGVIQHEGEAMREAPGERDLQRVVSRDSQVRARDRRCRCIAGNGFSAWAMVPVKFGNGIAMFGNRACACASVAAVRVCPSSGPNVRYCSGI